jgi:hypothetical protein
MSANDGAASCFGWRLIIEEGRKRAAHRGLLGYDVRAPTFHLSTLAKSCDAFKTGKI